jgi:hypothetical protein
MFVYESTNYESLEKDSITGKNVIEFCAKVLSYNNMKDITPSENNIYTVKFVDINGNILAEISEDGLIYAINGDVNSETDEVKEESQKFWELSHKNIISIEFNNPIHNGDGIWDEEYQEDEVNTDDEKDSIDSDEDYEDNINILF